MKALILLSLILVAGCGGSKSSSEVSDITEVEQKNTYSLEYVSNFWALDGMHGFNIKVNSNVLKSFDLVQDGQSIGGGNTNTQVFFKTSNKAKVDIVFDDYVITFNANIK